MVAQRGAPPSPEAVRKTLRKAETTEPAGKEVATGDGDGDVGYLPGYAPTGEYRRIQEVYGDLVHSNVGAHRSGGITDNQERQTR